MTATDGVPANAAPVEDSFVNRHVLVVIVLVAILGVLAVRSWFLQQTTSELLQRVAQIEGRLQVLGVEVAALDSRSREGPAPVGARSDTAARHLQLGVLERVLLIKSQEQQGTCFGIRVNNECFLVTAQHVVRARDGKLAPSGVVQVLQPGPTWKEVNVQVIPCPADIVALRCVRGSRLEVGEIRLGADGLKLGQPVHLLGFPLGNYSGVLGSGTALVKAGTVAGWGTPPGRPLQLIVDARVEPGMSGGPVVYIDQDGQTRIAGVIAELQWASEPVFAGVGVGAQPVGELHVRANRGFTTVCDIATIVEAILAEQAKGR